MNFGNNLPPIFEAFPKPETKGGYIIGGSFENSTPESSNLSVDTTSPLTREEKIAMKEGGIIERGKRARLASEERKARELFMGLYLKPEVVEKNTNLINSAKSVTELIDIIRSNNINIISPDPDSGDFEIYANYYLLEELNFINENLQSLDDESRTEANLRAKTLTRACNLRYKVRNILG